MSTLSVVIVDFEKFFKGSEASVEKFCSAFCRLFKKTPSALQTVNNFVMEVAPVIEFAVTLADPIAEPEVAAGLAILETGLAGLQAAATAAVSGTSLATCLQGFADSVPALLSGLAIKNPELKSTIERITQLVAGEAKVLIPAVNAWVAQIKANSQAA